MIYIYGDSHAYFSFKNLKLEYEERHCFAITMFRIGRDNMIINFNKEELKNNDIIILSYGEIDCRCHIQRQINSGKNEEDVINELVTNYFMTIINNIMDRDLIVVIVGIIPPTKQYDYEQLNGPILHAFPFVGTDEDRVRYTQKMNEKLEAMCSSHNFFYFNPYPYYTRANGTLKYEFSDSTVHLGDNYFFLEKFIDFCKSIS
jgi:hypothetical protein